MKSQEIIAAQRNKLYAYLPTDLHGYLAEFVHIEDKDSPEIIVPFQPWPLQWDALDSIHDNRLNIILKARQLGVTWLVLAYASWCLLCNAGWLVIALSRTEDEAKELIRRLCVIYSHMPELMVEDTKENAGFKGVKYHQTSLTVELIFPDGRTSTFKAFPSSSGAGRSFTANLLILDEWAFQAFAEQIWLSVYPTINRPTGGKVIGLSTIDRGTLFEDIFTGENGFNKIFLPWDADPRRTQQWYAQTKKDMGDTITQEYPATIDEALTIPGGSYFPEFQRHKHITAPQDITGYRRYVCLDYGLDMLSVHWIAVTPENKAIVYREYDCSDLTISDACKAIVARSGGEDIYSYLAPPDLWNREQVTGRSRSEIFAENGVYLIKTSNDLDAGCAAIKEWLQNGLTIEDGSAPNLCRCLTKIQKDKTRPNVYAKQPHDLTHDVDSLRCFCVFWTYPADTKIQKSKYTPALLDDWYNAGDEVKAIMRQKFGEPE